MRAIEQIAEGVATAFLVFVVIYIFGNVLAAWLRGAFEMVAR